MSRRHLQLNRGFSITNTKIQKYKIQNAKLQIWQCHAVSTNCDSGFQSWKLKSEDLQNIICCHVFEITYCGGKIKGNLCSLSFLVKVATAERITLRPNLKIVRTLDLPTHAPTKDTEKDTFRPSCSTNCTLSPYPRLPLSTLTLYQHLHLLCQLPAGYQVHKFDLTTNRVFLH